MNKPILVDEQARMIIGVETRTSNALETDPAAARIPALWQRYFQIAEIIRHKKDPSVILGVYTDYEKDQTGEYSLIVSSEVENAESVPPDLIVRMIPPAKYLVFTSEGEMPRALIETWVQIWRYFASDTEHRRAYSTDFEIHNLNQNSKAEIYIAVK